MSERREEDYPSLAHEAYTQALARGNNRGNGYRIRYFPPDTSREKILTGTPIPGQSRLVIPRSLFPFYQNALQEGAKQLGGRVAVYEAPFFDNSGDTLAVVSWRDITADDIGSRFVGMELETLPSRFLLEALKHGVHLKRPRMIIGGIEVHGPTQKQWNRSLDIALLDYFGKVEGNEALSQMLSYDEIGKINPERPISRERVRYIIGRTIRQLHPSLPDYLKYKYPLEKVLGQIDRPQFMTDQTGATRRIAEAVLKVASYQDLIAGFSDNNMSLARKILDQYGLHVPYLEAREATLKLIKDLKALTGSEDQLIIREVFNRINPYFRAHHKELFNTFCLLISNLCDLAGLKKSFGPGNDLVGPILQALDNLGIVYGQIIQEVKSGPQKGFHRILYILDAQKEQAIAGLQADPSLARFKKP